MTATMRVAPWQVGYASGSTSKRCWSRTAHRREASVGASRGAGTTAGGPRLLPRATWAVGTMITRWPPHPNARPASGSGSVQRSQARRKRDLKTVIPTHLPDLLPMECEVLAGAGGGFAVPGAGVYRRQGCCDTGDGHPGFGSGCVHRGIPEVADEKGESVGAQAECGGGARERRNHGAATGADGCNVRRRTCTSVGGRYEAQRRPSTVVTCWKRLSTACTNLSTRRASARRHSRIPAAHAVARSTGLSAWMNFRTSSGAARRSSM